MRESLLHARIRANPRHQLVPWDRLGERPAPELRDSYGLLQTGEARADRANAVVSRDVALLLLTLREPAAVPELLRSVLGPRAEDELERMIRERIIEIGHGDRFVCGTDALGALGRTTRAELGTGALSRLSWRALQHAESFVAEGPLRVMQRLYAFHRIPSSPRFRTAVPDPPAAARVLALDPSGTNAALIAQGWLATPGAAAEGWFAWRRTDAGAEHHRRRAAYKLYVSPRPDQLPDALAHTARVLAGTRCLDLKVARSPEGFLRPDKLVAYFGARSEILAAAERLGPVLAGMPAHGVPFTAELAGDGLLSWGADPPERSGASGPRQSWRSWLCQTLASALSSAVEDGASDPIAAAVERVAFEGVDVHSWTPTATIWS